MGPLVEGTAPEADIRNGRAHRCACRADVDAAAVEGAVDIVDIAGDGALHAAVLADPGDEHIEDAVLDADLTAEAEGTREAGVGDGGAGGAGVAVAYQPALLHLAKLLAVVQHQIHGAVGILDDAADGRLARVHALGAEHVDDVTLAAAEGMEGAVGVQLVLGDGEAVAVLHRGDISQGIADVEDVIEQHVHVALVPMDGTAVVLDVVAVAPGDHLDLAVILRAGDVVHVLEVDLGIVLTDVGDEAGRGPDLNVLKDHTARIRGDVHDLAQGVTNAGIGQEYLVPHRVAVVLVLVLHLDLLGGGLLHGIDELVGSLLRSLIVFDGEIDAVTAVDVGLVRLDIGGIGHVRAVHRLDGTHQVGGHRQIQLHVADADILVGGQGEIADAGGEAEHGSAAVHGNALRAVHGEGGAEGASAAVGGADVVGLARLKAQGGFLLYSGLNSAADGDTVVGLAVALHAEVGGVQHRLGLGARLLLGILGAVDGLGDGLGLGLGGSLGALLGGCFPALVGGIGSVGIGGDLGGVGGRIIPPTGGKAQAEGQDQKGDQKQSLFHSGAPL